MEFKLTESKSLQKTHLLSPLGDRNANLWGHFLLSSNGFFIWGIEISRKFTFDLYYTLESIRAEFFSSGEKMEINFCLAIFNVFGIDFNIIEKILALTFNSEQLKTITNTYKSDIFLKYDLNESKPMEVILTIFSCSHKKKSVFCQYLFTYLTKLVIEGLLLPSLVSGTKNIVIIQTDKIPTLMEFIV